MILLINCLNQLHVNVPGAFKNRMTKKDVDYLTKSSKYNYIIIKLNINISNEEK